ncbi:endonuclease/exonuclease/phosphatase family protein [Aestuariibaculum lutulentum]|uniref:Endonuclease/exonuclease/phosphatase family protein n=1 Tax=Aestuariibaculum lutulentum TaxID=2920935 RepID=A0ABS9REQ0_9FLAO|nr:endonuclease/exonuclease/phosphatase family protein [Aestuariibaculum lutulentum]MCH4551433.1 endonuclease/exonuclease/phosphatase family protein [Aestuariibaculum lutulentum]
MEINNTFSAFKYLLLSIVFTSLAIQAQTTVMSFNIRYDNANDKANWWEYRKTEVAKLIDYYHPDFLGIQEGLHHQVTFIKDHMTNYDFIGVGRDDGKTKGEYSALFYDSSKYDVLKQDTFWLSETPEQISVGWDASMERICTYGLFKNRNTGEVIYIFNTHFDHIGPKAQEESSKLILKTIEQLGITKEKLVVMGDLNSEPKSPPIQTLKTKLNDGLETTSSPFYGPLGTFNNFDPMAELNKRIDYIFTKNATVLRYRHIDDRRINGLCVSDHLPVFVKLK